MFEDISAIFVFVCPSDDILQLDRIYGLLDLGNSFKGGALDKSVPNGSGQHIVSPARTPAIIIKGCPFVWISRPRVKLY